jgi:tRNA (guanine-N7-)-methyltransferase
MQDAEVKHKSSRAVKSFSRRIGRRLTKSRKCDLTDHLPELSVHLVEDASLNPQSLFTKHMSSIEFEIGFGTGEHLIARALDNQDTGFIGSEPYINGVAKAVQLAVESQLNNLKVYPDDAQHLINCFIDHSIDKVVLLFPDPWPKKRHHVRRIVQDAFLNKLKRILKHNGKLIIATDHVEYACWIQEKIKQNGQYVLLNQDIRLFPPNWHKSKYHTKAENNGLAPFYFEFIMR